MGFSYAVRSLGGRDEGGRVDGDAYRVGVRVRRCCSAMYGEVNQKEEKRSVR